MYPYTYSFPPMQEIDNNFFKQNIVQPETFFLQNTVQDTTTKSFFQPNTTVPELETVSLDNIISTEQYPFNTVMDKICNIYIKLNDTMVTINNNNVTANKPILIECR